jgi:hypothetical protein
MYRKDYIQRQFEEFGVFLAKLFGLKKEKQWNELEQLVNSEGKAFTSIDIKEVEGISNDALVQTLTETNQLKEAQLKMLADLLYEKGLFYTEMIMPDESETAFRKALLIYEFIKANSLEIDFSLDMHFKMEAIIQLLNS